MWFLINKKNKIPTGDIYNMEIDNRYKGIIKSYGVNIDDCSMSPQCKCSDCKKENIKMD